MSSDSERISRLEAEVKALREVVEKVLAPSQSPQDGIRHQPSHWFPYNSGGGYASATFSIVYGSNGGYFEDGEGNAGVSEPRKPVQGGGAGGMSVQPHINVSVSDGAFVTELRQAMQEELAKHDAQMVAAVNRATPFKRMAS